MNKPTTLTKGETGYPRDNSYSFPVGNHKMIRLAGNYETEAVEVQVVSEPFTDAKGELEFVIVEHNKERFVVLNCFFYSKEAMVEAKEWMQQQWNGAI
tara:strand:+ start:149 stop:442 length:294 start_codon:yes stop_codon:yes gene_type:complete